MWSSTSRTSTTRRRVPWRCKAADIMRESSPTWASRRQSPWSPGGTEAESSEEAQEDGSDGEYSDESYDESYDEDYSGDYYDEDYSEW